MFNLPKYEAIFDRTHADPIQALPNHIVLNQRYELGQILGQGGFAITYLAWDKHYNHPVVVKELCPKELVQRDRNNHVILSENQNINPEQMRILWEQSQSKFRQESTILFKLPPSTNRVSLIDFFSEFNTYYYVMSYQVGQTLRQWVRQYPPAISNIKFILDLLKPLWLEIDLLHQAKILHRDIKPDNILIIERAGQYVPVIIDFGIARVDFEQKNTHNMTFHAFSDGYAAPEQRPLSLGGLAVKQGAWTDIYSVAAVLLFSCTRCKITDVFEGYTQAINHWCALGVSQNLAQILSQPLKYHPEYRPQNIKRWLDSIEENFDPNFDDNQASTEVFSLPEKLPKNHLKKPNIKNNIFFIFGGIFAISIGVFAWFWQYKFQDKPQKYLNNQSNIPEITKKIPEKIEAINPKKNHQISQTSNEKSTKKPIEVIVPIAQNSKEKKQKKSQEVKEVQEIQEVFIKNTQEKTEKILEKLPEKLSEKPLEKEKKSKPIIQFIPQNTNNLSNSPLGFILDEMPQSFANIPAEDVHTRHLFDELFKIFNNFTDEELISIEHEKNIYQMIDKFNQVRQIKSQYWLNWSRASRIVERLAALGRPDAQILWAEVSLCHLPERNENIAKKQYQTVLQGNLVPSKLRDIAKLRLNQIEQKKIQCEL